MEDLQFKAKVLIIDDESGFLELIRSQLELKGYEVATAIDGEEGLSKAKAGKPDLIICDIKMPKKTGYDVLKELRSDKENTVPFIMLSSATDFNSVRKAYDGESDFYMSKPVQLELLDKNIKMLINLTKTKNKPS